MTSKKRLGAIIVIIALFAVGFFLGTHTYGYTYVSGNITIIPTYRVNTVQLGSSYITQRAYYIPRIGYNYHIQGTLVTIGGKTQTFSRQIYFDTLPQNITVDGMAFTLQRHFIPVKIPEITFILQCLSLPIALFLGMLLIFLVSGAIKSPETLLLIGILAAFAIITLSVGAYMNYTTRVPQQTVGIGSASLYIINDTSHMMNYKYVVEYSNYTPVLQPLHGYTIYSSTYQTPGIITYYVSRIQMTSTISTLPKTMNM